MTAPCFKELHTQRDDVCELLDEVASYTPIFEKLLPETPTGTILQAIKQHKDGFKEGSECVLSRLENLQSLTLIASEQYDDFSYLCANCSSDMKKPLWCRYVLIFIKGSHHNCPKFSA